MKNVRFRPSYRLKLKDIAYLEMCSMKTAQMIKKDIKARLNIPHVRFFDYCRYHYLIYGSHFVPDDIS